MIARNHVDHARWCLVPDGSNVKWREVAVKRTKPGPGCYGSVDGAPACKLKGCRPGQVPSGGHARGNHTLMFLSLSFSLLFPLSKVKKK